MRESPDELPLFKETERAVQELVRRAALDEQLTDTELRPLAAVYPFSLACTGCDADLPGNYAAVLAEGWTGICFEDGPSYSSGPRGSLTGRRSRLERYTAVNSSTTARPSSPVTRGGRSSRTACRKSRICRAW